MQFDNANFEKNVKQSINTVEKLKSSLEIGPRTQEAISNSLSNIDFSGLASKVDSIADRFSTFGIVGMTAVQRITNAFIDLGLTIERKVIGVFGAAWNQIITGGTSRASNIEKATFQLKGIFGEETEGMIKLQMAMTGTSEQIKELTGLTEDLIVAENAANYAVADTAYGLDSAAKAASVLATSGVDVVKFVDELADESGRARTEMQVALRAISGTAAMANTSYDEMAHIFERISGQNRVMGEDLNSLSSRGLNAAAVLADYLNEVGITANATQADIKKMCSKGEIDFMTFAKAMDKAYGEHAKDANSTFSGAFDNMRFALSKIGADFIAPMRDDLIPVLNNVRMSINAVRSSLTPFVDAWKSASHFLTDKLVDKFALLIGSGNTDSEWKGSDQWINAISNITNVVQIATDTIFEFINLIDSVVRPISSAWKEIFPSRGYSGFVELLNRIKDFISNAVLTTEAMNKLNRVAKGVFSTLKIAIQVIKPIISGVIKMASSFGWLKDILVDSTATLGDRLTEIANSNVVFNKVSDIVEKVTTKFEQLSNSLRNIVPNIKNLASGFIDKIISIKTILADRFKTPALDDININMDKIYEKTESIRNFFTKFKEVVVKVFTSVFSIVKQIGSRIARAFKDVFTSIRSYFSDVPSYMKFENMFDAAGMTTFIGAIALVISKIVQLKKKYSNFFASNDSLIQQLVNFINDTKNAIFNLPKIITSIKNTFNDIDEAIKGFKKTQMLQVLAVALVAFVASIYVLSKIDSEKALDGIIMVGLIITYLRRVMESLEASSWNTENLTGVRKAIGSLVVLSISTLILASAISKVAKAFGNSPMGAILGLITIYVSIEMLMRAMEKVFSMALRFDKEVFNANLTLKLIKTLGLVMIEMAIAVRILAGAVNTMTKAFNKNPTGAIISMIAIVGFMEEMMRVLQRLSIQEFADSKGLSKAGFAMVEIGAALALMAVAVKIASTAFKTEDPLPGILGVITVIALMEVMVRELTKLSSVMGGRGASGIFGIQAATSALVGVAIAMSIVGATVAGLAFVYSKNPGATLAAAITTVAMLFSISKLLEEFKPKDAIKNGFALIEVALAVAIIGKSITKLSAAYSKDPLATLAGLVSMISMLGIMALALEYVNPVKAKYNALAMIEFAAALYLISAAVAKIGKLGVAGALTGVGGLIAILLAIAGFSALVGSFAPIAAGLILITSCITAMGAAMLLGGAGFALFGIGLVNVAAGVAALAAAWAVSGPMIVQGIVGTLSAIAMAIPTVAAALAHGLLTFIEILLDHVGTIVNLVKAIVVAVLDTISEMVPRISKVLLSLLMFALDLVAENIGPLTDKLITVIVSLISSIGKRIPDILGAISEFLVPLFDGLIDLVSGLLGVAAEGIGYIFGSLIGGIIEGIGRALRNVSFMEFASELSDFMWALEPFIDGLNGLNKDSMEAAALLAGVITVLTADAIINGLTKWFAGDNAIEDFGKQLAAFGPYIKSYANSVDGINVAAVEASACAATMCAEFAKKIPNEGGLVAKIVGDNDIEKFGEKLAAFGPYIKQYANSVKGLDVRAVQTSVYAALMLAGFANNIPNEGGLLAKITGDNDIQTFGIELKSFGKHIAEYAKEVKDIDAKSVEASVCAALMLSDFAKTIPNSGGLAAIFSGDNTVDKFGEQLAQFGASINDYYNSIKDINTLAIANITDSLLQLFDVLGVSSGINYESVSNLRDILEALASAGLDGYFDAIAVNSTGKIKESVSTFARNVNSAFNEEADSINTNARFRGNDFTKAYADGIKDDTYMQMVKDAAADVGDASVEALGDAIGDPLEEPATESIPVGHSLMLGYEKGEKDYADKPVTLAESISLNAANALDSHSNDAYNSGYNLISQFNQGAKDASNNKARKFYMQHAGYYSPNLDTPTANPEDFRLPAIGSTYKTLINLQSSYTESTEESSSALELLGDTIRNYTRDVASDTTGIDELTSTYADMAENARLASDASNNLASSTSKTGSSASKASQQVDDLTKKLDKIIDKYEDMWDTAKENANKDLFKGVDDQGDDFLDSIKEIMTQYEDIYTSAVERTNGQNLFAEVNEEDESFAPETLLNNLEDQVNQVNELNSIIASLSGRITDANLRAAIANMDVDNLPQLRAMYRMTSDQLGDYEKMYQQKVLANQNKIQNELTGSLSQITGEYTNVASYIATDQSTDILIRNLQAQVNQLNEYNDTVASLMGRIQDVNLREAIAHMGVDSLDELKALNSMTDAQLNQYINIYNQKIVGGIRDIKNQLSTEVSSLLGAPIDIDQFYTMYTGKMAELSGVIGSSDAAVEAGKVVGSQLVDGASEGIDEESDAKSTGRTYTTDLADGMVEKEVLARVEANAKMVLDTINNVFVNAYDNFKSIGEEIINRICSGIDFGRRGAGFTNTLSTITFTITNALVVGSDFRWLSAGEAITNGITRGMNSSRAIENLESSARAIAAKAVNAVRQELKIASPSKVFMQIGRFIDEGLAIGIKNYSNEANNAAGDMALGTISPVQEAINQLSGMLDGSIELNPTITPTLDLSDINARSAALSSMFNGRQIAIQARADEQQAEMMAKFGEMMAKQPTVTNNTFNQTNNSPKPLSRGEIYRQTKTAFSQFASAIS